MFWSMQGNHLLSFKRHSLADFKCWDNKNKDRDIRLTVNNVKLLALQWGKSISMISHHRPKQFIFTFGKSFILVCYYRTVIFTIILKTFMIIRFKCCDKSNRDRDISLAVNNVNKNTLVYARESLKLVYLFARSVIFDIAQKTVKISRFTFKISFKVMHLNL